MEEDAQIAREREQLKREMDKLHRAVESIVELESSSPEPQNEMSGADADHVEIVDDGEDGYMEYDIAV
jgi:hypothetical protein